MSNLDLPKIFQAHEGGKISTNVNYIVKSKADLAIVYTPGVAEVCKAVANDMEATKQYTIKKNTVCVLSDGSAVLGLGNIGAYGAIPVMEGKAMLFKAQAGVNAFPICVKDQTVEGIIAIAKAIEPVFGGINLEDISAPRCFELSIPVFHDDQHGTAIVSLSALLNALKVAGKKIEDVKIVVSGAGAAGVACAKLYIAAGAKNIIVCDTKGAIYKGRTEGMNWSKEELAEITNPNLEKGMLADVIAGADVFLGVSGPRAMGRDQVLTMAKDPIVFALANPTPEVMPEEVADIVGVMATGRSDFPNQINNILCFPGLFKGLLEKNVANVTEEIKLNCAYALANMVTDAELNKNYVIVDALDPRVVEVVSGSVK
jgi:malate dehydrogenase (oxaloacetate-decarboxylating)